MLRRPRSHMNNAQYNSLLDYARMDWFLRVAAPNVLGNMGKFRVGNGGVTMYFLRGELSPLLHSNVRRLHCCPWLS